MASPTPAEQSARALYDAGARGTNLLVLTAIALAENGASLTDLTKAPGTPGSGYGAAGEVGPWQIHPVHFGTGVGQVTQADANTYAGGAREAVYLAYDTPQGLSHWSTFTDNSYQRYAVEAGQALRTLPDDAFQNGRGPAQDAANPIVQGAQTVLDTPGAIGKLADNVGKFTSAVTSRRTWLTVLGVTLIVGGVVVYIAAPAITHGASEAKNIV